MSQFRPLVAQAGPFHAYFHRSIDRDQGLPETQVNAIAQTPDGYLWLGTRRGLVRYDGINFRLFDRGNSPALPSEWINTLTADRAGRVWIGTTKGLAVLDHGVVARVPSVPDHNVWILLDDGAGRIWVGTDSLLLAGNETGFTTVPGTALDRVHALYRDDRGRIWFAGRSQFGVATADTARLRPHVLPDDRATIYAFAGPPGRAFWAGTASGVHRIRLDAEDRPSVGPLIPTGGADDPHSVWGLAETADGLLWIGTNGGGMEIWDGRRLSRFSVADGLSSRQVLGITVDSQGRVWAGSGAGLERFQRTAFTTFGASEGLLDESIWSVRGAGNTLWAAAFDGSIRELDGAVFRPLVAGRGPNSGSTPSWPSADGRLWVAVPGRPIAKQSHQRGNAGPVIPAPPGKVVSLFEDRLGSLWISTDSGLFRANGRGAEPWSARLGLPSGRGPRVMTQDSAGRLFFGATHLTVLDGDSVRHYGATDGLDDPRLYAIYPSGRNVWIGTADSGLYLLRGDRISALGAIDRRLRQETLGVVEDDRGFLWLTSSYGLTRVATSDLEGAAAGRPGPPRIRRFDRYDGLPTTEFNGDNQSVLVRDSAGQLWLPSYAGVVRVEPERIAADTTPPRIHLEELLVDGAPQSLEGPLVLPPGVGRFEVAFAATDALVPSRVRIQYRMEGVDDDWIEAGAKRTASYGPLDGGRYRFVVRAANEDGHWSRSEATIPFRVRYKFHQQPFFWPAVVLTVALAAWTANLIRLRRLHRRERELSRIVAERTADLAAARDHLERRVDERTQELADELAERKRLEQQLVQSQKLESIGRLAGGVAHEINNMMTGVLGFTNMAATAAHDRPDIQADLDQVRRAGERAALVTRQLLAFARRQQAQRGAVRVDDAIRELDRFIRQVVGPKVTVTQDCPDQLRPIAADRAQIDQLIVNLVMNARDAMPNGGVMSIRASETTLTEVTRIGGAELLPGDYQTLEVADNGAGMSAAVKARLFEPFFTTKEVNRGSGLGLAVCFGIVSQHGGAIAVESELDRGTRFTIWLPVGVVIETPVQGPVDGAVLPRGSETILIAEDEDAVRTVATRTLTTLGYHVIGAADGPAALALLVKHDREIDLLITDIQMPGMAGPELATACRARRPDLPIVFMSGFPSRDGAATPELGPLEPMLAKPFSRLELATIVRRELDTARRATEVRPPIADSVPGR